MRQGVHKLHLLQGRFSAGMGDAQAIDHAIAWNRRGAVGQLDHFQQRWHDGGSHDVTVFRSQEFRGIQAPLHGDDGFRGQ